MPEPGSSSHLVPEDVWGFDEQLGAEDGLRHDRGDNAVSSSIGMDTVGSCTDAFLYDLREHQIIRVCKRPTIQSRTELLIVQALDDIIPVCGTKTSE